MIYRFEKKIKDYILRHHIKNNDSILVAFSGGPDSLALTIALKRLKFNNLKCVYVNHNLRSAFELDKEIELNKLNTNKLGVELLVRDIDKGKILKGARDNQIGIEAEARNLRLKILEEEQRKYNAKYIATAHNSNDRDEWEIISFFRGGIGFSTIPEYRFPYIRPMINATHNEAIEYCKYYRYTPSIDSTNEENDHLRCKVRNILVPVIESIFPSFNKALENKREIYSTNKEKDVSFIKIEYMEIDALCIDVLDFLNTSIPSRTTTILNVLSSIGKETNGGRFSLKDVNEILYVTNISESKTLLISGVYIFKTSYLFDSEKLVFMKKSDVDAAITRRDTSKSYVSEGIKIQTVCGTKSALKILKDKKVPRVLRQLVLVEDINKI